MKTPLAVPFNNILSSAIKGCDIVHVQFPFYLGVRAIHFARKFGIPVVSTFHIQAEHLARNAGIRSHLFIQQTYHYWIHNIYNPSDMVICPSVFALEELKRYGLNSPFTVISNGILPCFQPLKSLREKQDQFVILSVGRYAPEKRQEFIIRAVGQSRFRDRIQLLLIGDGPMKEKLRELGDALPRPPFFSTLELDEMVTCYNQADLYVHAADVEVECMSVLEAMACGLPPLIADSPKSATRQFALDDRSLFNYDNLDELVNKLDYWISHQEELFKAKKQYQLLSEKYRFENSLNQLIVAYHQLLRKNV
jgi:glycosyltransferase involved in cell wall biosynthesis